MCHLSTFLASATSRLQQLPISSPGTCRLGDEFVPVVDSNGCGEHLVPQEYHPLLQRPLGVQSDMKPRGAPHTRGMMGFQNSDNLSPLWGVSRIEG
jgi:hypothetical protein